MSKFALFFLLIFFGGILATFFATPVASVALYLFVYFMNPEIRWWGAAIPSLSYSFITVFVMMLVLMFNYKKMTERAPWKEQNGLMYALVLTFVYYMMGFVALQPEFHNMFVYNFAKLIVVVFVVYKAVGDQRSFNLVIWAYIIGATYIGYYAGFVGRNSDGRVEGIGMVDTGSDGNHTAAALVPALILLLYYVWLGSWQIRVLSVVCAAFLVNGLVLINSRGSFIGCAVGAAFFLGYMIFSGQQRKGQKATAYAVIIFGLAGAFSLTDQSFWDRLATLQNVEDGEASGSHRIDFWLATFDVIRDNPLGVGIGGFETLSRFYLPEHYFVRGNAKAVHSSWFQLLAEAGWQGVIVFALLVRCVLLQVKKTKKFLIETQQTNSYFHVLALQGAFLGYLSAATFINRIRAESLWWCILFLMIATNIYYLQYKNGYKKIESLKDETEKKRS